MARTSLTSASGALGAAGRFITRFGFPTFVAVVALLAFVYVTLFRSAPAAEASGATPQQLEALTKAVDHHAAEATSTFTDVRNFNRQILQFELLKCLRDSQTQRDRDVCQAVLR